jgi:hypothetical protein
MKKGLSVGGISVPSGTSTKAAFSRLAIKQKADGISVARPKSKTFLVKGAQRITPAKKEYFRTTDKLAGYKDAAIQAGEKMPASKTDPAKVLAALKKGGETVGGAAPSGSAAQGGGLGGGTTGAVNSGYFGKETLAEKMAILRATKDMEAFFDEMSKTRALKFKWKEILPTMVGTIGTKFAEGFSGALFGPMMEWFQGLMEGFFNTKAPTTPKWMCKVTVNTPAYVNFAGVTQPASSTCYCSMETTSKKTDQAYLSGRDTCVVGHHGVWISKASCTKQCP